VGVVVSLAALVYERSRPHTALLGRLPGTDTFRNLARYPEAERPDGVTVYRVDAALCFANAEFLRDQVRELVETEPSPRALVFDFHAVNGVDSTALHQVEELLAYLRAMEVEAFFAGVKGPVMDRFRRAGLARRLGPERFFFEVNQAVDAAQAPTPRRGDGVTGPAALPERTGAPLSPVLKP
jgi:sulfate permease, SulP family